MPNDVSLIETTIAILDGVNWAAYGDHQAADYLAYVQGAHGDERELMDGLLGEFLEKILGFTLHQDLLSQRTSKVSGKRPDFIPDDTHLHPFVFDAKGTDTQDLGRHYAQIAHYMRTRALRYGVLSNLRDLDVYTLPTEQPEPDYSFSFYQLYRDYQRDPAVALAAPNTERFFNFVQRFQRRALDRAGKLQAISDARHTPQSATLDLDDLVRRLHNVVAMLHEDVRQYDRHLPDQYRYKPERRERIALEIDTLAREIDTGAPERKIDDSTLAVLVQAAPDSTDGRALDRYCYRVAYFAMTRILLARVWEDIGFIDQVLYDGGFAHWYAHFNQEIQRVLSQAFHFAQERYTWLYGAENNYTWYTPSETVLVDVLYEFSRFDFRALDADVLGAVYEAYLDETDRKNKGQYYTPRSVVQFIWDRVGFDQPDRIFRFAKGARGPRVVADFCTGSGGFLVEAARRIREAVLGPDFDPADADALANISIDDLTLAMLAIIEGLRGAEINAFAYYLTEVNLLIQLTPIIAAIQKKAPHAHRFGRDFALSVLHQDALKLHNRLQPTLSDTHNNRVDGMAREDEIYEEDRRHDIVSFTGFKRIVYDWLKEEREMDYVCSNPPYVGEKGHKEMFRYYRNNFEYWDEYYQGKMDYLYWFIILGLSKLRDGGQLGYITTSYWPTASGAKTLRKYILDHAKIIEMIDFGETRIFSDAPGQHNMIIVLERCDDKTERAAHRPWIVKVRNGPIGGESKSFQDHLDALLTHILNNAHINQSEWYEDDVVEAFRYPISQANMGVREWSLSISSDTHSLLSQIRVVAEPLSDLCQFDQGIQSNADRLARSKQKLVIGEDYPVGAPIFVLTQSELDRLHLTESEREVCKPFYKNSDLTRYLANYSGKEQLWILYLTHDVDIDQLPNIKKHLAPFKVILEARNGTYGRTKHWYELHRTRDVEIFEQEHLAVPRLAPTNIFTYSEPGIYENSDISLITRLPDTPESLKYLLSLLNSCVLIFWCLNKNTRYGNVFGYYGRSIKYLPIRRIRFDPPTDEATKQAELANLNAGLEAADYDAAYDVLHQALEAGQEDVVHDGLVALVDQIIALKKELAGYNHYFDARLTRLEEGDPLPAVDPLAVVRHMPDAEQWNVMIHLQNHTLRIEEDEKDIAGPRDDFYFYRVKKSTEDSITLRAKGRGADTLTLRGDPALIAYLARVLPAQREQFWREVKTAPAPKDMAAYTAARQRILAEVTALRAQIAGRQSVIDRIVLDLYGITDPEDRETVMHHARET